MSGRRYPPKRGTNARETSNQVLRTRNRTNSSNYPNYTTVVDYDAKYNKRQIKSNWEKYQESKDSECDNNENKAKKPFDFSFLVANASSDCSHFEFRCEKEWKLESELISTSTFFNLDLKVLSNGLACVPFHERIGLDKSDLTPEDKAVFDKAAENQWKVYNPIKDNFLKQHSLQSDNTQSCVDDFINKLKESTLEELLESKLDLNIEDQSINEVDSKGDVIDKSFQPIQILKHGEEFQESSTNKESEVKEKTIVNSSNSIFKDDEENLEEWLDSMLDD